MSNAELLILFRDLFHVTEEISEWFSCGENAIRLQFKNNSLLPFMIGKGEDLIFTAESRDKWQLETVSRWIDNIVKEYES